MKGGEPLEKEAVADLQRNYNEVLVKMSRKQKDVEKGRFSLGDQVLLLNQDDNIDAFVFVHAFGQKKSGGKKALAVLTLSPLMFMSTYFVNVGIADARTGDVLTYTQVVSIFDITKEDDKNLVTMLKRGLKKLPSGELAGEVTKKK
ncbi:MAG: hypothetical protein ACREEM_34525 [Blastocatellia bacterium]